MSTEMLNPQALFFNRITAKELFGHEQVAKRIANIRLTIQEFLHDDESCVIMNG